MAPDNLNLNGPTGRPNLSEVLSTYVSDRTSRRSFFTRAGSFFCGLIGVGFVRAALAEAGEGPQIECLHEEGLDVNDCNVCSKSGGWGGLHGIGCDGYKRCQPPGTPPEFRCIQDNGCPKGSTAGEAWVVCIACEGSQHRGEVFRYRDCCGAVLHPLCAEDCNPNPPLRLGEPIAGPNCDNDCEPRAQWCGTAGELYFCTHYENTHLECGDNS